MVWHIPTELLAESISALRAIDEQSFSKSDGFGVCRVAHKVLPTAICVDVYEWTESAMICYDHEFNCAPNGYLEDYFHDRFALLEHKHYYREDITALRMAWLVHIIHHLEVAL